jgi:hypothetical protein
MSAFIIEKVELEWIKNVQFVKKSTPPLMPKRSTAVTLAPKKPIRQNKPRKAFSACRLFP